MMRKRSPVIRVRDVWQEYRNGTYVRPVLKDVSLDVAEGDVIWISGSSGSGKSTLLRILGLLFRPSVGTVEYCKADEHLNDDEIRGRHVGIVFQEALMLPHLSLRDNLAIASIDEEALSRSEQLIERFGLGPVAQAPARVLSGGELQRASLCRAMVNKPQVILADEPTSSLDAANANAVLETLDEIHCNNPAMAIVIASHDERVQGVATRIMRVTSGYVREEDGNG